MLNVWIGLLGFFFIAFLFVFFVFGLAYLLDLDDKKTRVLKTVVNSSTPNPTNLGFALDIGLNQEGFISLSVPPARVACHMLLDISPFDVQQVIYYQGDSIGHIVLFQTKKWLVLHGTETTQEWNKDLLFDQLSSGVHRGFWQIYQSLDIPKDVHYDFFIGHSLGAALCLLLLQEIQPQNETILFGCPRVGSKGFVATIPNNTITRYVNIADIICELPPPVSPNFVGNPDDVFLYTHVESTVVSFETNTGSYLQNHRTQTYLQYIQSIT